jgi:MFS family permease
MSSITEPQHLGRVVNVSSDDVEARRTLAVAAYGTLLVLAVFSALVTTVGESTAALHSGVGGETWALSGMSLGLASTLLIAGTLADDLGRRTVLIWSAGGLVATSLLAAAAPSTPVLVASRILQGVAGAGILAATLGMIGHAFPAGPRRAHASGVWGGAVGAGIAIGPLAGAALAAAFGWRSPYVAEAAAAAALLPAAMTLPESRAATRRGLDVPGVVTLTGSMACLTAGLIEGRRDWTSPAALALLGTGTVLLIAFAMVERRRRQPMVEPRLFLQPTFVASLSGAFFTGLAIVGLMSYTGPFLERQIGIGPFASGAVLAGWSATSMVVALLVRRLPGRDVTAFRLALGLLLCAVGEAALTGMGARSTWVAVLPGLIIAGVGSGVGNAALGRLAVESVPRERAAMGSGANNTARYLGGAAGVALVVALAARPGAGGLAHGWNTAAAVSAVLCAVGALTAFAMGALTLRAAAERRR